MSEWLTWVALLFAVLACMAVFRIRGNESRAREEAVAAKTRAADLELRVQAEKQRADNAEQEFRKVRDSEAEARRESAVAQDQVRHLKSQLQEEKQRAVDAEKRRDAAQNAAMESREKVIELESERRKFPDEIKVMAQNVLEQKSNAFDARAQEKLQPLIGPLSDAINNFRQKAEEIDRRRMQENTILQQSIETLKNEASRIAGDANNLADALKGDRKALGNWGETVLEMLLQDSGLEPGWGYEPQAHVIGDDGERQHPDFIIHVPSGPEGERKHLIVDSKANLSAYHDYVRAVTDEERKSALDAHVSAVRRHARDLSKKYYQRGRGLNSPDFVFMFMPIEAAWVAALAADERLFAEAYKDRVVLVARTTLLPTLKTVAQLWQLQRQTENVREIAKLAGRMRDKFANLLGELKNIDEALGKAKNAYQGVVQKLEGRDNLIRQAERLEEMGMGGNAKKKLPRLTAEDPGE